jgi:DNA-binding MarR family transcriptional regulator
MAKTAKAHWLDDREAAAWRGLLDMHAHLTAELSRRLAAKSTLSSQDYAVLAALTDQPEGRLRPHELTDLLEWEKSRLSHHIARMTARGLVKKVACGTDRRGAFVVISARGRRAIESAAPEHVADVRELFVERLTPSQLDALAQIAEQVLSGPLR